MTGHSDHFTSSSFGQSAFKTTRNTSYNIIPKRSTDTDRTSS